MAFDDLKMDITDKHYNHKGVNISLQMDFNFIRAQPMDALTAFLKQNRTLDYTNYNDCQTGQELLEFSKFTCGRIKDKTLSTQIIFTQAFNPALVLGQNNWIVSVNEKQEKPEDLLHDIKITYYCDNSWNVRATLHPTRYSRAKTEDDKPVEAKIARKVDPYTCQLKHPEYQLDEQSTKEMKELGFKSHEEFYAF